MSENLHQVSNFNKKLWIWEFGQNDPKRDSGSKMKKLGLVKTLKVGQTFQGIVLSSEAKTYLSCSDKEIVDKYGIACINCSWNRLEEIPFRSMGKNRNQRLLPTLLAANTVNYGKPFKLNTAEAMAACLYISGYKDDAAVLLDSFSYGEEFFKINFSALELYSNCINSKEVIECQDILNSDLQNKQNDKEIRLAKETASRVDNIGGYMEDMDLPPMDSYSDYEYETEEVEEDKEDNRLDI